MNLEDKQRAKIAAAAAKIAINLLQMIPWLVLTWTRINLLWEKRMIINSILLVFLLIKMLFYTQIKLAKVFLTLKKMFILLSLVLKICKMVMVTLFKASKQRIFRL